MLFPDYSQTGLVYHIISLNDLAKVKAHGIRCDDKPTYQEKYRDFHTFLNLYRPENIPGWVNRTRTVFASMNFKEDHAFHSHSMLLAFKVHPPRCWVANENRANQLYEPFVLHSVEGFYGAKGYIEGPGRVLIREYWDTSLSFNDNLRLRRDRMEGYDAEVLVFHDIKPEYIQYIAIVSDHRIMTVEEWRRAFCIGGNSGIII
ncbi:MAG: hypothetical protein WCS98_02430 [Bacillota bacterium]|jgi:hypothetical protein|nr:hypothetical protein [Bacillota bacterium]MDD3297396.1 hypothetical protein [Bacillota bacterium]MDD3850654.1 hypothetical protein [Bacillota bacterium]MDD4707099.1 hypothetical protein [Bacillota bacterium]